ncbi:MAG: class I SAM-dependent methyltransferase [Betaproteobacteria bacterium]|nr:class I SAM-dependent methyltransferase [Betaproteobacteria bacterium]
MTQSAKPLAFPPGHFYSAIVDPAEAERDAARLWPDRAPELPGIDFNDAFHVQVLTEWFPRFMPGYDYPEHEKDAVTPHSFFTRNSQFSWLDARALYVLMRAWAPRRIVEVGSGFSSLLMADVNLRHLGGKTAVTCIEPYPRPFLKAGVPGIETLIEARAQDVSMDVFSQLAPGDILFIDSSHVSKTGSDVNYLFLDVLPRLAPGVRIHVHDVFLPLEYPRDWVIDMNRSWNEQYLLRAMLTHSNAFKVLFGATYAFIKHRDLVIAGLAYPKGHGFSGGSLWIERL